MMDLGKNGIGIINTCFLKIFGGIRYIVLKKFYLAREFFRKGN